MKRDAVSYLYLSGRVRAMEDRLPPWEAVWRMTEAESRSAAQRIARENGVDTDEDAQSTEREKARLFDSLSALDGGKVIVALFRCPYDCHNAKALLKSEWTGRDVGALLSPCGSVPTDRIAAEIQGTRQVLPAWLRDGIAAAQRAYRESRNAQRADAALDRARFAAQRTIAKESGCVQAEDYVRLLIDGTNLQTLLRRSDVRPEALEELLIDGGIPVSRLMECRAGGTLPMLYRESGLRAAAESGDPSAAESALEAELTRLSRFCALTPYGAQTLLAFLMQTELRHNALRSALGAYRGEDLKKELKARYG